MAATQRVITTEASEGGSGCCRAGMAGSWGQGQPWACRAVVKVAAAQLARWCPSWWAPKPPQEEHNGDEA